MDSFDDFEFKPLTEGLGFHKKPSKNSQKSQELPPLEPRESLREKTFGLNNGMSKTNSKYDALHTLKFDTPIFDDPKSQPPVAETTRLDAPETKVELPELAPEVNLFSKPLPRTEQDVEKVATPAPAIPKFNPRGRPLANPSIRDQKIQDAGILSVLEAKTPKTEIAPQQTLEKTQSKVQAKVTPNKVDTTVEIKYTEVAPSALSLFLDFTVITGLSILFMLGLVMATGLDLVPILTNTASDTGTQIGVILLAYSVSQLYLILSRSFFGQTLGEWSMDTQLGLPKEQEQISYAFKLIGRTLVLAVSGFITLPLISMIMGKDIAGRAVNLKLYRR